MMYFYWTKGQTTLYKTLHKKLKIEQHEPTNTGGKLRYSGRVSSSCFFLDIVLSVLFNTAVLKDVKMKPFLRQSRHMQL